MHTRWFWFPRCVLELFTFVVMGGTPDRIELVLVVNNSDDVAEMGVVGDAAPPPHLSRLQTFDVRQAQCHGQNNVAKILQLIQSSGSLEDFNAKVIATLGKAVERAVSSARKSFSENRSPGSSSDRRSMELSMLSSWDFSHW